MLKFHKLRSRLLYRYIVSYLLVFLLPFLVMSIIIYKNSVTNFREEIEQSNLNKLQQAATILNDRVSELDNLTMRIANDYRVSPYMMKHDFHVTEGINELKKYKANSSIIEEVFIYYHDEDKIYSTKGSYALDTLTSTMYQFKKWDEDGLRDDLYTQNPFIKPAEDVKINNNVQQRMIAYLYPIAPKTQDPYGTVMYFIDESVLTLLIQNVLEDFKGNTYIVARNDQVIASAINDENISFKQLIPSIKQDEGVTNIKHNGKHYSVAKVDSEISGWEFITLMESDQFFEKVFQKKTFIMFILIIQFIAGLIMAILFGKKQYQPIQTLLEQVKTKRHVKTAGHNELETIGDTISHVFEAHHNLNEAMDAQSPLARDQLLIKMLKGELFHDEQTDVLLNKLNISMYDGVCFVAIIDLENGAYEEAEIEKREAFLSSISKITQPNTVVYGVDLLYHDAIALITSVDENTHVSRDSRRKLVEKIQQNIYDTTGIKPTIGVGDLSDEKSSINSSYIAALAALEYKFAIPQGNIIYFEELTIGTEQELGYPLEKQIKLAQSLKQGDQIVAKQTLRSIFEELTNKNLTIQTLKCVCFDIINTIVKTTSDIKY
ncbi:MAG TPA: hypothetical protein VK077_09450, partial [Virgibacillus sp.]|nr:hypothetical protein [Virgibacillus sp.]